MSSIVISGDTSGAITLAAPSVAGTNTATLPAATGTVMVSGNMPAFSVYQNSATSLTNGGYTKIAFQTKEFDTNNCFDNTTNYRFTPTVAGYYQLNASIQASTGASYELSVLIYKNGSVYKSGTDNVYSTTYSAIISSLVYLNGSTDYVEIYSFCGAAGKTTVASSVNTYFNGSMVRAS